MKRDMFDLIFKWVAVAVMGAQALSFVTNKADLAKFDSAPIVQSINNLEKKDVEQDTERIAVKRDISDIKNDLKEIKNLFYEQLGYPKSTFKETPILKGVH